MGAFGIWGAYNATPLPPDPAMHPGTLVDASRLACTPPITHQHGGLECNDDIKLR